MGTSATAVLGARLARQGLSAPLRSAKDFEDLFRLLQPVTTIAACRPGDPPRLVHRTRTDSGRLTEAMRGKEEIVKARLAGGTVGYVLADELELYANAFCKPLKRLSGEQEEVLRAISDAGPLTARQLKEETGLLSKRISPALQRLQQAFLVFERQVDGDWDRGWFEFASEWPDVTVREDERAAATESVVRRFFDAHVFASLEQLRDWSRLPAGGLKAAIASLVRNGHVVPETIPGLGEGWRLESLGPAGKGSLKPSVFMLHAADYLVRSHVSELKRTFGGTEVLQYLLIDGRFQGAVVGHWRIGPHDVDDIVLTLPASKRRGRRDEILAAVAAVYREPDSRILRFDGKAVR